MRFFDFFTGDRPSLIEQCLEDMRVMLDTSLDMFSTSSAVLLDNEVLSVDLDKQDDVIDEKEAAIRRAVLEHIAIDPTREMVFSLILLSIVQDAERIGDLAKSLGDVAALAHSPRSSDHVVRLRGARDRVMDAFKKTRTAFVEADESIAREVMDEGVAIKGELKSIVLELANSRTATANEAIVLGIGARMMSRISSHLSNVASSVALPFDQIRRPPGWE